MTNENQLSKIMFLNKEIEVLVKEKFDVRGRGLHTYLDSIESEIDSVLVRNLRYIATIRNQSMHESVFEIEGFLKYEKIAKESIVGLKNIPTPLIKIKAEEHAKILKEKNHKQNIFLKHSKYIIIVLILLLLIGNAKSIFLIVSNMLDDKSKNIKEEIGILSDDILDENGEIKNLVVEVVEVVEIEVKEINNTE